MPPKRLFKAPATASASTTKLTMDEYYFAMYSEYTAKYGPKTAVLMLVGRFFEMYDAIHVATGKSRTNVQELADVCAGSFEPRPTTDPAYHRIFWGFPETTLPKYERALISAGYRVVVFDQEKDATGKVTERKVKYIASPGTYIDTEDVGVTARSAGGEDRHLVGIVLDAFEDRQGRAFLSIASTAFDPNTGTTTSMEADVVILDGTPVVDALLPFWDGHPPAEVIVWTIGDTRAPTESQVLGWFSGTGFRGSLHIRNHDRPTAASQRGGLEFLGRLFAPQSALSLQEYLGISRRPAATLALVALLKFLEEHNPSHLLSLRQHRMWDSAEFLTLGNAALEQLAMLPASNNPAESLLHWLQKAVTAAGRRALRERLIKPITDIGELEARQDRIAAFRSQGRAATLAPHFHGISDLARIYRTFQIGKGVARTLQHLLSSYLACSRLVAAIETALPLSKPPPQVKEHLATMLDMWDLERIMACTTGHTLAVGPHHPWRRGQQPVLDALEDRWAAVLAEAEGIRSGWAALLEDGEDAVKLEIKEEEMFVFTATKRRAAGLATLLKTRRGVMLDVQTRGSSSTATLGTPAIAELNQKALGIWTEFTEAVGIAWKQTWSAWRGFEESEALLGWLGQTDAECALALVAEEYDYVRPTYEDDDLVDEDGCRVSGLAVTGLRHPILERVHTATPYISHSIRLGCFASDETKSKECTGAEAENGILLYGVNAAGKSTLSKAVGLAVLMAQTGMPVPATAMTLVPYTHLYTRILGNDNLWAGMSSFVVEMTEFRSILRAAGPRTLVLGDELCAGTETVSATAIVAAGIQTLVERGAHFLFATHLHELVTIPEVSALTSVKPYHLSVKPDPRGFLVYDRCLRAGAGSSIYGLEVCRGLDMDAEFLERAFALRARLEGLPSLTKTSRYNAAVPVQVCHVCGAKEALEVHHIRPQAEADGRGRVGPGQHKNDVGNLAVLCGSCHDQHHAGKITIRGWVTTSAGRILDIQTAS